MGRTEAHIRPKVYMNFHPLYDWGIIKLYIHFSPLAKGRAGEGKNP
jgi:hypothetical protein